MRYPPTPCGTRVSCEVVVNLHGTHLGLDRASQVGREAELQGEIEDRREHRRPFPYFEQSEVRFIFLFTLFALLRGNVHGQPVDDGGAAGAFGLHADLFEDRQTDMIRNIAWVAKVPHLEK